MSAPPISGSEAGAQPWELRWEALQEAAHAAHGAGDPAGAARLWRRAWRIAFWRMARRDPRYAASLANRGFAARLGGGNPGRAYRRAAARWASVPEWIEGMEIARRARSSLFHLRLEARHADTYRENSMKRYRAFAAEAQKTLEALRDGGTVDRPPIRRWKGEKPPLFDDTRRLLAACLMIAVPLPPAEPGVSPPSAARRP